MQNALRGDWTIFFCWHVKNFFLLHCVPLYVCRLCINYQDLRTKLLGVGALRMLLLNFISTLVIDFLSIRKVIIFSAIATDDRHPLWSRSLHQNAANCKTIAVCFTVRHFSIIHVYVCYFQTGQIVRQRPTNNEIQHHLEGITNIQFGPGEGKDCP